MVKAYQYHMQFIILMIALYVIGVWGAGIIYLLFPLVLLLLGLKKRFFELIILSIWILILSDYIPLRGSNLDDLKFAKDLKYLVPLVLFGNIFYHKSEFDIDLKLFYYFVPFFIIALLGLSNSLKVSIGIQKSLSYVFMFFSIPIYIKYLHKKYGSFFWNSFLGFLIGILLLGIILGFVAPQIGIHSTGRFKGVFGNPNGQGVFVFLVLSIFYILKEFKLISISKREQTIIISILLISLFWSESRNTIMSVVLFYLSFWLIKINWLFGIIVITAFILFQDYLFDLILLIIESLGLDSYFRVHTLEEGSGRKIAWVFAWQEIQNTFFIGGGFGHDENIMRANYSWLERKGHNGGVHNSYLSIWFDSGIVGLVFYFVGLLTGIFRSIKKSYISIAFLIAFLFNITYESWLVGSLNPFTILFIIILTIFIMELRLDKKNTNLKSAIT